MTKRLTLNPAHRHMYTKNGESLTGTLDSRQLGLTRRLTILARKAGLDPVSVRMGFNGHDPMVIMRDGSKWIAVEDGGMWDLYDPSEGEDLEDWDLYD